MDDTLAQICSLWSIPSIARSPVEIPNVGRDDLARLFAQLNFNLGVEVGTEQGLYAEVLCKANPNLNLFCIDPYQAYNGYREHVSQPKLDTFYDEATQRLAPYNVSMYRGFSVDIAKELRDEMFDFVYLDGNHSLLHVVQDLYAWIPKIRKGGIISGHDYIQRRKGRYNAEVHVVEAVTAYTTAHHISPYFIVGTKEQREGEVRDSARSWFWLKG